MEAHSKTSIGRRKVLLALGAGSVLPLVRGWVVTDPEPSPREAFQAKASFRVAIGRRKLRFDDDEPGGRRVAERG